MAELKQGQVDWRKIADGIRKRNLALSDEISAAFEPLVKAADRVTDRFTSDSAIIALRAALDDLPKVGG